MSFVMSAEPLRNDRNARRQGRARVAVELDPPDASIGFANSRWPMLFQGGVYAL